MAKPIYIELHVRNQMIVGVHKLPRLIVEGSKQFVYLMIDFDEEWSDSSINVIFSHDSARRKTVSLAWHGEALEVPQELLVPGGLRISCVGHADDGEQRLTTHYMSDPIRIYRAGPLEGDEVQNAPAPLWEQTLAAVGSLGFLKTEDRSSAVAAINEIFGLSIAQIEQDAASDKENVITITLQNGETKKFVIRNVSDHDNLLNRDAADQHPISAVSGLQAALDDKQPKGPYLTEETDPTVPAWAKQPEKPTYTAEEVHALPDTYTPPVVDATLTQPGQAADAAKVGKELSSLSEEIVTTSEFKVSAHNTGADTHGDIRLLIQGLTDRLNALADSDDTTLDQLSEVVAYIKSNRTLIEAVTTSKVSVADIIDNLTTNVSNKPLSAAQGVALKALIDGIVVPDKLPNPNALTFTGAVTGSYDGSEAKTIEIPIGGGGGVSYRSWSKVWTLAVAEDIAGFEASNIDLYGKSEIMIVFISDSTSSRTMGNGRLFINGVDAGKVLFNNLALKKDSHSFVIIGRADVGIEYTTMQATSEYQYYPWTGEVKIVHRMVSGRDSIIQWTAGSTIEITQESATLGQGITIEIYVR